MKWNNHNVSWAHWLSLTLLVPASTFVSQSRSALLAIPSDTLWATVSSCCSRCLASCILSALAALSNSRSADSSLRSGAGACVILLEARQPSVAPLMACGSFTPPRLSRALCIALSGFLCCRSAAWSIFHPFYISIMSSTRSGPRISDEALIDRCLTACWSALALFDLVQTR